MWAVATRGYLLLRKLTLFAYRGQDGLKLPRVAAALEKARQEDPIALIFKVERGAGLTMRLCSYHVPPLFAGKSQLRMLVFGAAY